MTYEYNSSIIYSITRQYKIYAHEQGLRFTYKNLTVLYI